MRLGALLIVPFTDSVPVSVGAAPRGESGRAGNAELQSFAPGRGSYTCMADGLASDKA
jgi:hypothetical protein